MMGPVYEVKRDAERKCRWVLRVLHGDGRATRLASYTTRKHALTVARLMAGRTGSVRIVRAK